MKKLNSKIAIELVNNIIKLYHTMPVKFTDNQKEMITKIYKWSEDYE